jgi:hypothetical protein
MMDSTTELLDQFPAPYGKEVRLDNVTYENGMRVLRIHIREGNRHTVMDIDQNTAFKWASVMNAWVESVNMTPGGNC